MHLAQTEWTRGIDDVAAAESMNRSLAITVHGSTTDIEATWRAFEAHASGSPFQRFCFFDSWMRHIGERAGYRPLIAVGRDASGAVAFIMPLVIARVGPFRVARFAGGTHANCNVGLLDLDRLPAVAGGALPALKAAIADAGMGVDALHLAYQPVEIDGRPNPFIGPTARPSPHASYDLSLEGGFAGVLERHRGGKKRKRQRAHARGFEELGGYSFRRASDPAEASAIVEAFLSQKADRLARHGLPNVFAAPGTDAFLKGLTAGERPLLEAYALEAGGVIRATAILAPFGRTAYFIMNSFAEDAYARLSPGEVALFHLIEDMAERGFQRFDFGIGDARYKRSWCDRAVPLVDQTLPLGIMGYGLAGLYRGRDRLKAEIIARPRLHAFVQRMRRGKSETCDGDSDGGSDGGGD